MSQNKLLASQYVFHNMLLSKDELNNLLPEGVYVILGALIENPVMTKNEFIDLSFEKETFKVGFSFEMDAFEFLEVGKGQIAQLKKPVVEIKPFTFTITSEHTLLEEPNSKDSWRFGLSFSYPRLYSQGSEVVKTRGLFKEADFFDEMRVFKRKMTKPAIFDYKEKKLMGSMRVGLKAFSEAIENLKQINGLTLRQS
jgi:hypothetical protein